MVDGALAELRAVAEDRLARAEAARRNGVPVAGYVGADVPRELLEAAGVFPLRLAPLTEVSSAEAERILGPGVDEELRRILAGLLEERYPVDVLLCCHADEQTARLYTTLRALRRTSMTLWFLDLLHGPRASAAAYSRRRLAELADLLASWAGRPLALTEAIAEANGIRRLMAELTALRRQGRVTSAEAHTLALAGTALPAADYRRLLECALPRLAGQPRCAGPRVLLAGSGHPHADLYALLDELGATVVAEEDSWGGTAWRSPVDERAEPLAALAARYREPPRPAPVDADLCLVWLRAGDEARAWATASLRRRLAGLRTPVTELRHRGLRPSPTDRAELARVLAPGGR